MTGVMLLILLGLGSWQVKRLFWKEAILAEIARAESGPPIPLHDLNAASPYSKVSVTGEFLPDLTALYGAEVRDVPSGSTMGAHLIEPLRQENGTVVLIDRGWVPLARSGPIEQPSGTVTVAGYVRPGEKPAWFSATDDPAARRFFTLDPKAIGESLGKPDVAPFVLVALGPGNGPIVTRWPEPADHLPRPPNNHLSYAITWYGLAVALLAIFIVWARKGSRA